jgi:hypothetical protein
MENVTGDFKQRQSREIGSFVLTVITILFSISLGTPGKPLAA